MNPKSLLVTVSCFIFYCLQSAAAQKQVQDVYIKAVQCNNSAQYVHNMTCFAKSYSRTLSTINIIVFLKKPTSDLFVELRLFFKYGVIYREALHSPVFNVCEALETESSNRVISQIVSFLTETVGRKQLHPCPYSVVQIANASIKTNTVIPIYPTGDYKFMLFFTKGNGEMIAVVNGIASLTSPNKDTFG